MAHSTSSAVAPGPIKFGTDGWRGVIAANFTFERLFQAATAAAQTLLETYGPSTGSRTVIVGYDRRFMSEEFAQTAAAAVQAVGLEPLVAETYAPTPAFSWAANDQGALGALVITASHNPGSYSGLKVKGAFGGSVPSEITQQIEAKLTPAPISPDCIANPETYASFNPWERYCKVLQSKVDIAAIRAAVQKGQLIIYTDVMHGAAAGGLQQVLEADVHELHGNRDPLFGGGSPEPLPRNLSQLFHTIKENRHRSADQWVVGFVFDGDADRIAAVDGRGEFLSSQVLIPILIEHLATRRNFPGEVVKTVSGSDLMPKVAALYDRPVFETPVGYKYIAERMLTTPVLIGGEESGGIGYGSHIPERDGLLAALYLLEAIVQSQSGLDTIYQRLQQTTNFYSAYDRIDLPLASLEIRDRVQSTLQNTPPTLIADQAVLDCNTTDGFKFRLADQRWLMIRFSGTEPLLRLYCEAATPMAVHQTLAWAKDWAQSIAS
ncbi:MAG: phosphoglucomutase/phosphomannomutase family protein [Cyanobacteria bacterium P01_H01_bin.121]